MTAMRISASAPALTATTPSYDLDMDEVAAELYAALQYIESCQITPSLTPLSAVHAATPEMENEQ